VKYPEILFARVRAEQEARKILENNALLRDGEFDVFPYRLTPWHSSSSCAMKLEYGVASASTKKVSLVYYLIQQLAK